MTEMSLFKAKELSVLFPHAVMEGGGRQHLGILLPSLPCHTFTGLIHRHSASLVSPRPSPPPSFVPPVSRLDHGDKPVADAVMQRMVHS